jgi:hypothetical protein
VITLTLTKRRSLCFHRLRAHPGSGMQGNDMEGMPMTGLRRLLRLGLFAAAAAACIAAALQLREQRATVAQTAEGIEAQLNGLDPVTRAAVIARLSTDATQEIKSHLRHQSD